MYTLQINTFNILTHYRFDRLQPEVLQTRKLYFFSNNYFHMRRSNYT